MEKNKSNYLNRSSSFFNFLLFITILNGKRKKGYFIFVLNHKTRMSGITILTILRTTFFIMPMDEGT